MISKANFLKSAFLFFILFFFPLFLKAQEDSPKTTGTLSFEIRDADSDILLPGKLVFLQGDTIVNLGLKSQDKIASRKNTIYTADGTDTVAIPVGEYEVWAGRGFEYSTQVQKIAIKPEGKHRLLAKIRREVDTRGYVGGDMHLHTLTYSGHGDAQVDERIISCLGEGLEWAVATDHNHVTDYAPVSHQLDMSHKMLTTIGNEITTSIGHFNAYPLPKNSEKINHTLTDANALFKLIRSISDNVVIQINHPRWPSGDYYTIMEFDDAFAFSENPNWSWEFDAFELLNENRGLGWKAEKDSPISVREDWFNMLNNGWQFTAVGNSDSHHVLDIIAGVPRNYIASSTDDPAEMDEAELVENIKRRNVSVNRGLYVEFSTTDGAKIGEQVKTENGNVTFHIRVQAPAWIACDTVQLIGNGEVVATYSVQDVSKPLRFLQNITVQPEVDTWYIAVASGTKSMAPLIHDSPVPVTPLGFTNPIWVDADGDNRFTSLYERAGRLVTAQENDPTELAIDLAKQPSLHKYALAFIAQNNVRNKSAHFAELLAKSNLTERLLIYKHFGRSPDELAKTTLQNASASASQPIEKSAIAMARFQSGEKAEWQTMLENLSDVENERFLHTTLRKMGTGNFLKKWSISMPYSLEARHGLETVFPPEMNNYDSIEIERWQNISALENGIVNLVKIFDELENAVAYAYTEIHSKKAGNMLFLIGSDDGIALWLNGQEIHRKHIHRRARAGDDMVVAPVRKGQNVLLVKIENGSGGWGFCIEPIDVMGLLEK